jgi:hypothetical protein
MYNCAPPLARPLRVSASNTLAHNAVNHERWALTIQASRFARVCLEEAFKCASAARSGGGAPRRAEAALWPSACVAQML